MTAQNDPYDLKRFVDAQVPIYNQVLSELQRGQKRSHWMWYIFPQIDGLGASPTAKYYAIKNQTEAQRYLAHPILGNRLRECTEILLNINGRTASQIFGYPDDLKLNSSLTLFATLSDANSIFHQAIDKYYHGKQDTRTLDILKAK